VWKRFRRLGLEVKTLHESVDGVFGVFKAALDFVLDRPDRRLRIVETTGLHFRNRRENQRSDEKGRNRFSAWMGERHLFLFGGPGQ
jgi:hypothetical protein